MPAPVVAFAVVPGGHAHHEGVHAQLMGDAAPAHAACAHAFHDPARHVGGGAHGADALALQFGLLAQQPLARAVDLVGPVLHDPLDLLHVVQHPFDAVQGHVRAGAGHGGRGHEQPGQAHADHQCCENLCAFHHQSPFFLSFGVRLRNTCAEAGKNALCGDSKQQQCHILLRGLGLSAAAPGHASSWLRTRGGSILCRAG